MEEYFLFCIVSRSREPEGFVCETPKRFPRTRVGGGKKENEEKKKKRTLSTLGQVEKGREKMGVECLRPETPSKRRNILSKRECFFRRGEGREQDPGLGLKRKKKKKKRGE